MQAYLLYTKYREEKYPLMNKIIKALNSMHNKTNYEDQYKRNPETLKILNSLEILFPIITEAKKQEMKCFLEALDSYSKIQLEKYNKNFSRAQLGSWWFELPKTTEGYNTSMKQIHMIVGSLVVEEDYWNKSSYGRFDGCPQDTDIITLF